MNKYEEVLHNTLTALKLFSDEIKNVCILHIPHSSDYIPDDSIYLNKRYEDDIHEWIQEVVEIEEDPEVIIVDEDLQEEDSGEGMLTEGTKDLIPSVDLDDPDAAMAWLENLAAKQGISEDELITSPEDRSETPPEWIQETIDDLPATPEEEIEKPKGISPQEAVIVDEIPGTDQIPTIAGEDEIFREDVIQITNLAESVGAITQFLNAYLGKDPECSLYFESPGVKKRDFIQ